MAEMPRSSGTKKKRNFTGNKVQPEEMPKVPRSPVSGATAQAAAPASQTQDKARPQAMTLESLLAGMEERLGSKIDTTNTKVEKALELVAKTNIALEDLDIKMEIRN